MNSSSSVSEPLLVFEFLICSSDGLLHLPFSQRLREKLFEEIIFEAFPKLCKWSNRLSLVELLEENPRKRNLRLIAQFCHS